MPRPTQFAKACIFALSICLTPALLAQKKSSPPKPASTQNPVTSAAGRSTTNPTGGIIYGSHWWVMFDGIPPGWLPDTSLAHKFGVQEIFHPPNWNPRRITPCITFAFSDKVKGDATMAENMAKDERGARARFPNGKILPAPALAISARQKAPVRIYEYPYGWDMVVYSEQGNELFVSTLHCEKASQCARFKSSLAKFVESLEYNGNVTVTDQTKH